MSKKSVRFLITLQFICKGYSQPHVHKRRANCLTLVSLPSLDCQRQGLSSVCVQHQPLEVLLWVIMELLDTNRGALLEQGQKARLPHTQTEVCLIPESLWSAGKWNALMMGTELSEHGVSWASQDQSLFFLNGSSQRSNWTKVSRCSVLVQNPLKLLPFLSAHIDNGETPGEIINWNHKLLTNCNNHNGITKWGFKKEGEFYPQKCINYWISKNASSRQCPV